MLLHFLVDENRGHSRFRNGLRYLHPDIGGYGMFLKSSAQRLKVLHYPVISLTRLLQRMPIHLQPGPDYCPTLLQQFNG